MRERAFFCCAARPCTMNIPRNTLVLWIVRGLLMVPSTPLVSPLRVVVLMPLRDDWASAAELIRLLDQAVSSYPYTVDVLLVDDGSVQDFRSVDFQSRFSALRSIRILRLRRNLGHQRAIAIGLVHVQKTLPCDAVLVMDSDGEDTPNGALQLLG